MVIPCSWDVVIPSSLCPDWDGYPTATKDTALWLASTYLWAATGRQYGPCSITVRPSQTNRAELAYQDFAVMPGTSGFNVPGGPFLFGGRWFNAGCGTACCGNSACAIVLRGPVASVDEVVVGDEVVPASAYRVDVVSGAWLLVRIDGECWPMCQDFRAEPGEPGSFEVTYSVGRPLPEALAIATAALACQYGKSIAGGPCALPARMTRLSRQGVEVEVAPPEPDGKSTGVKLVDDVIAMLNPNGLKSPPVVMSLDLPEQCDRITVIGAGS